MRLIRNTDDTGYTDDDIRRRFSKLPAADIKKVIDRIHREAVSRQNYSPPHSVQATAGLIRYVIETTTEIQTLAQLPGE